MVIQTQLKKDQFVRLTLMQHLQRPSFYFWAITSAALTAWALFGGPFVLIFVGWLPFGLYLMSGIVMAFVGSRGSDKPYLQPTRYEFDDQGIKIGSTLGESFLEWQQVVAWKVMSGCYVLLLANNAMLAFPQDSVAPHRMPQFEQLLIEKIERR